MEGFLLDNKIYVPRTAIAFIDFELKYVKFINNNFQNKSFDNIQTVGKSDLDFECEMVGED